MGIKHHKFIYTEPDLRQKVRRVVAILIGLCLFLSQLSFYPLNSRAEDTSLPVFQVGESVTAVLEQGVLTLSGQGMTNDFTAETAPFLPYADDILELRIEDGITYIGSCLFYGLGNLSGELSLPGSITGFGSYAFSGDTLETAPSFSSVVNAFEGEQQLHDAGSLFFSGQSGTCTSAAANTTFIAAASAAGYTCHTSADADTDTPDASVLGADETAAEVTNAGAPPVVLTSESNTVTTVYVDQATGNDTTGNGTRDTPFQSLDRAAATFTGTTVAENVIVLLADYTLKFEKGDPLHNLLNTATPTPVTIQGDTPTIKLIQDNTDGSTDQFLTLTGPTRLTELTLQQITHIYGNGYDITIADQVDGKNLYLYGAGRTTLGDKVGHISVYSGSYIRIIGYIRSNSTIHANQKLAHITVGGSAVVSNIVAGSASGAILDGNVRIDIEGGKVTNLIGGNQGYTKTVSPFNGTTQINISGNATVTNIFSAGSGQHESIPTYKGTLDVNITGGTVESFYGAGSAAYVISDETVRSKLNLNVSGGSIGTIYAAGMGGNALVNTVHEGTSYQITENTANNLGSFTGDITMHISDSATINGNIYTSGQGYKPASSGINPYSTTANAYRSGSLTLTMDGGTVTGSIYGGGAGFPEEAYVNCARVTEDSTTTLTLHGGTVRGNVYGGGKNANVYAHSSVVLSGCCVEGNVYGGGENGTLNGSTSVQLDSGTVSKNIYGGGENGSVSNTNVAIAGGLVSGSVYGGAKGTANTTLVTGSSTLNMTGGTISGSLYGGSELSNNGPEHANADLIFVNLAGGTVSGNVFGGSYKGYINGSTHLHIGSEALADCNYYKANPGNKPSLSPSALTIGGSAYAGGDYGSDGSSYDTITISGTSHVYIDGTGYHTEGDSADPAMHISDGVFGSGASCDAGKTRLVTLENYGVRTDAQPASRTLTAIQRADRVALINSHIRLSGKSDVANQNQTELYSLNRLGDHGPISESEEFSNGLLLQGGSTLVLDAAVLEVANLKSVTTDGNTVTQSALNSTPNSLIFSSGTVFRLSYTKDSQVTYGAVTGYAYMSAADTAVAYTYARAKTDTLHNDDGGFVSPGETEEIAYTNAEENSYRYWQIAGKNAVASRNTVLTAQTLKSGDSGYFEDNYSVAKSTLELPPTTDGSTYTINSITIPSGITLVDAGKENQTTDKWKTTKDNVTSGTAIDLETQKTAIQNNPLTTFGLSIDFVDSNVISAESSKKDGTNSIIGKEITYKNSTVTTPTVAFYLTYWNNITTSKDLGSIQIEIARSLGDGKQEITTMNIELLTKASVLSDQTVDLYATQNGTYTGNMIIPSGTAHTLSLSSVTASAPDTFVSNTAALTGNQFAISMRPQKGSGWNTSGLLDRDYDLKEHTGSQAIGTTDSRYEAPLTFTLHNAPEFTSSDMEKVTLTLTDAADTTKEVIVTLNIHREASIVSAVTKTSGRQYNTVPGADSISMLGNNAFTAAYTLNLSGTIQASSLWLELKKADGTKISLPAGTDITLLGLEHYYTYTTTGDEADQRILLSAFKEMWKTSGSLSAVSANALTVLVNFQSVTTPLSAGTYSLHFKTDRAADHPTGAAFTIADTNASVSVTASEETHLSRGTHTFTLAVSAGSNTHFTDGAIAVLSPGHERFPEGTIFTYAGNMYYPNGGSVYIPLTASESSIVMDTTATSGLRSGANTLEVKLLPAGIQAGGSNEDHIPTQTVSYTVAENPSYALKVTLDASGKRNIKAGDTLTFAVSYETSDTAAAKINMIPLKKEEAQYKEIAADNWRISGNTGITQTSGTQTITVATPDDLSAGTYRLNFTLGASTAPYNIIVTE